MKHVPLALFFVISLSACGRGEGGEPASVWFISPVEGAELTGPNLLVRLGASGVRITSADIHEPGTGHHHIFVNRDLTPLDDTIPAGVGQVPSCV